MGCRKAFLISSSISYQHSYLFTSTVIFVSANGNSSLQATIFHHQVPSAPPTLSSHHRMGSEHQAHAPHTSPLSAVRASFRRDRHRIDLRPPRLLRWPAFGLPDQVRELFFLKGHQNPGFKDKHLDEHLRDLCRRLAVSVALIAGRILCGRSVTELVNRKRTRINRKLMMMTVRAAKKKYDLLTFCYTGNRWQTLGDGQV